MEFTVRIRSRHAFVGNAGAFGICGNSGDTVRFDFDTEWAAYPEKTAYIAAITPEGRIESAVPFTGEVCPLPVIEHAAIAEIGVSAGTLRTTTAARIPYAKCITDIFAEMREPQQDLYSMLLCGLMITAVELTVSPKLAMKMAKISTQKLVPLNSTPFWIESMVSASCSFSRRKSRYSLKKALMAKMFLSGWGVGIVRKYYLMKRLTIGIFFRGRSL